MGQENIMSFYMKFNKIINNLSHYGDILAIPFFCFINSIFLFY